MLLSIDDHLTLADVQDKFSDSYPGLKLMFYKKEPRDREEAGTLFLSNDRVRIGEIRKEHRSGELHIFSWYTVREVEKAFRNEFGLHVRIFRNELNEWIPVTHTAKYSLRKQQEFSQNAAVSIDPLVDEQLEEYGYL